MIRFDVAPSWKIRLTQRACITPCAPTYARREVYSRRAGSELPETSPLWSMVLSLPLPVEYPDIGISSRVRGGSIGSQALSKTAMAQSTPVMMPDCTISKSFMIHRAEGVQIRIPSSSGIVLPVVPACLWATRTALRGPCRFPETSMSFALIAFHFLLFT
jgi:hypothetical protein